MNRTYMALLVLMVFCIVGCRQAVSGPKKQIEVPQGGAPVFTVAERRGVEPASIKSPQNAVRPASFEQPAELRPLKPLEDWTEQEMAADALGRIGQPAVPELVNALGSLDPNIRLKAVEVLGRMGPEAAQAVPSLTKSLEDPDERIRKAAARTLGRIGPAAQEAVPALVRTLLDQPPTASNQLQ
jgi:hypothetical protein